MECDILKLIIFCHFGPFFSFYLPNNPENQDFEKVKKSLEMSSFYTCVPKVTIISYMLPEIWSAANKIFCRCGPFFALSPH